VFCLRDPLQYAAGPVYVPAEAAVLLTLFDGRHSLRDIQEAYTRRFGGLLFREHLEALIRGLDEHLLLDGPRFEVRRLDLERQFREAATRPAALAGRSYPADAGALREQLAGYFQHPDGPRETPPSPDAGRLTGLIVPHIDFQRGGPWYARGYREAEAAVEPDRWVVLGISHVPTSQPFVLTRKDFETPLGTVLADHEVLQALLPVVGPAYLADEFVHRAEHSIEFQAVFLRHHSPAGQPVRIVPILCGSLHRFVEEKRSPAEAPEVENFLAALRQTLLAIGGTTGVLVSADLAHVGPQFGDMQAVTPGRLRELRDEDLALLRLVETGDGEGFFRAVMREGDRRRICGLPAIYAALRLLPGARGRVLGYGQWPDPNGTVTFAALGLYRGETSEPGPPGDQDAPGGRK
jgi:AmmeMemoRadiSam system protein B